METTAKIGYGFIVSQEVLESGLKAAKLRKAAKETPPLKEDLETYFENFDGEIVVDYPAEIVYQIAGEHPYFSEHLFYFRTGDLAGQDDEGAIAIVVGETLQYADTITSLQPLVQPKKESLAMLEEFRKQFFKKSARIEPASWVMGSSCS